MGKIDASSPLVSSSSTSFSSSTSNRRTEDASKTPYRPRALKPSAASRRATRRRQQELVQLATNAMAAQRLPPPHCLRHCQHDAEGKLTTHQGERKKKKKLRTEKRISLCSKLFGWFQRADNESASADQSSTSSSSSSSKSSSTSASSSSSSSCCPVEVSTCQPSSEALQASLSSLPNSVLQCNACSMARMRYLEYQVAQLQDSLKDLRARTVGETGVLPTFQPYNGSVAGHSRSGSSMLSTVDEMCVDSSAPAAPPMTFVSVPSAPPMAPPMAPPLDSHLMPPPPPRLSFDPSSIQLRSASKQAAASTAEAGVISLADITSVKLKRASERVLPSPSQAASSGRPLITLADLSAIKLRATPSKLKPSSSDHLSILQSPIPENSTSSTSASSNGKIDFTEMLNVKLKKVNEDKSPGGTPMRVKQRAATAGTGGAAAGAANGTDGFLFDALQKKFKRSPRAQGLFRQQDKENAAAPNGVGDKDKQVNGNGMSVIVTPSKPQLLAGKRSHDHAFSPMSVMSDWTSHTTPTPVRPALKARQANVLDAGGLTPTSGNGKVNVSSRM